MPRMKNLWEVKYADGRAIKVAAGDYDDAVTLAAAAKGTLEQPSRVIKAEEIGNVWVDCNAA